MDEIAVSVKGVYKDFKLPHEKVSSVKSMLTGILKGKSRLKYDTQHALRDINFEIKKGEFFGIVGRNGSGKSTLLKIIAGIYQPTRGEVKVNGKLVPFIELGVGFNPELTGRENVFLNGAILGFSKKQIEANYQKIVDFAELAVHMDQKLKNYSSGMQVRLAFACATMAEAEILLVDEVLAVGDTDFQKKCFGYFKKLKRDKKTVVFVTHDMNAVREYCDRAILINNSVIKKFGTADKVSKEYSRMFINENINVKPSVGVKGKRWGDGSITYTKISASPARLKESDEHLVIECVAKAKIDILNPVFGFTIKNQQGLSIAGTNTLLEQCATGSIRSGESVKITWTIQNIFNDGKYFIEPAIVGSDMLTTADWFEDAGTFSVYLERHTGYIVKPKFSLVFEKQE